MLFWAGSVLAGFLGYKLLAWWVPAAVACAVAAGQFLSFHLLLGEQGARLELVLFSLILNLTMYYATFSIGRAIGERRARRRQRKARKG